MEFEEPRAAACEVSTAGRSAVDHRARPLGALPDGSRGLRRTKSAVDRAFGQSEKNRRRSNLKKGTGARNSKRIRALAAARASGRAQHVQRLTRGAALLLSATRFLTWPITHAVAATPRRQTRCLLLLVEEALGGYAHVSQCAAPLPVALRLDLLLPALAPYPLAQPA